MDRCTGHHNVTEILLKTALSITIQSSRLLLILTIYLCMSITSQIRQNWPLPPSNNPDTVTVISSAEGALLGSQGLNFKKLSTTNRSSSCFVSKIQASRSIGTASVSDIGEVSDVTLIVSASGSLAVSLHSVTFNLELAPVISMATERQTIAATYPDWMLEERLHRSLKLCHHGDSTWLSIITLDSAVK